ncbi:MAG: hypothetical protein Q9208_008765 [Pyrenodesmia sp. 3 TL-2023]
MRSQPDLAPLNSPATKKRKAVFSESGSGAIKAKKDVSSQSQSSVTVTNNSERESAEPIRHNTVSYNNGTIPMSISEENAFKQLEKMTRRFYLAYLTTDMIDERLVTLLFPGMSRSHDAYKKALRKAKDLIKTWKGRLLDVASEWMSNYLESDDGSSLLELRNFKSIKNALTSDYRFHWAESLFYFAKQAVDWDRISNNGRSFLKSVDAFIMIITLARWFIESLSAKQEFRSKIVLGDFPLSEKVVMSSRVKKKVNLDEDSDADVGSEIFNHKEGPHDEDEAENQSPRPRREKGKGISNRAQPSSHDNNNQTEELLEMDNTTYGSHDETRTEGNQADNAVHVGSSTESDFENGDLETDTDMTDPAL